MNDRDLSILVDVTQQLEAAALDERGLRQVTDSALQLTGADHASLRLCDDAAGELRVAARSGVGLQRPAPRFRIGEGLLGWVARTGRSARVADCHRDPRFRDSRDRGYEVGSAMSLPLRASRRVQGVLSVSSPYRNAFDVRDEQLARLLCHCAAQALQLDTLRTRLVQDSHTRAHSHAYLAPRLAQELARAARSGDPLSLLMLDLDHFKHVNDAFGHQAGDAVLHGVVELLLGCLRSADVVVRRGGDEFVLILPETGSAQAQQVGERIGRALRRQATWGEAALALRQTASMGVATWDGREPATALEARADQAMYAAKRAGRDRLVVAPPVRATRSTRQLDLWSGGAPQACQ